jgi:tetratricopeptide (TPR) repeat protein
LPGLHRAPQKRRSIVLLAALSAALWGPGYAGAAEPALLAPRLAEIQEVIRVNPQRALPMLDELAPRTLDATPADRAEFLSLSCILQYRVGHRERALPLCDQALALARQHQDQHALARGLLAKAYALFAMNEMAQSHQLVWEAEQLAASSPDFELRVRATISSGEAFAEDGNFPAALGKMQAAASLARQSGNPLYSWPTCTTRCASTTRRSKCWTKPTSPPPS